MPCVSSSCSNAPCPLILCCMLHVRAVAGTDPLMATPPPRTLRCVCMCRSLSDARQLRPLQTCGRAGLILYQFLLPAVKRGRYPHGRSGRRGQYRAYERTYARKTSLLRIPSASVIVPAQVRSKSNAGDPSAHQPHFGSGNGAFLSSLSAKVTIALSSFHRLPHHGVVEALDQSEVSCVVVCGAKFTSHPRWGRSGSDVVASSSP